jgi:hypothetical protein
MTAAITDAVASTDVRAVLFTLMPLMLMPLMLMVIRLTRVMRLAQLVTSLYAQ